jgi:drug/metabolite transporter (DMT)-like permease
VISPAERTLAGTGLGVAAYALFALHDAANKWLVALIPVWEVLCFRSIFIVLSCLAIGRTALLTQALATPLKAPLAGRGVLTVSAWLCYFSAAPTMQLAQLLTLYFAAPVMVTLMASPLLGERVTPVRWASVGIGFAGVLVASDPFGVRATLGTALVLIAACLWGYAVILMRKIARRESSLLQMFFQNSIFVAVTLPLTLLRATWPDPGQWALMAGVAVAGGLGQFLLFESVRRAPAAVMATVEYTSLIWAFVLGWLIWGDIPPLAIWAGAALILIAGGLLVWGERPRPG